MNTCTKCGFTCKAGCLFVNVKGRLLCKKCAGTARLEEAAEIRYLQQQQGVPAMQENVVINPKKGRRLV